MPDETKLVEELNMMKVLATFFILSSYLTVFFRTIKLGWAIGERKR